MRQDPDVDAIDICLPTHQHAAVALAALRAGKHVLVEKPMALDGEAADGIVARPERKGPHADVRPGGALPA